MARIQVLKLPTTVQGHVERVPFVLIIDELGPLDVQPWTKGLKEDVGAEAVICFDGTMDVA